MKDFWGPILIGSLLLLMLVAHFGFKAKKKNKKKVVKKRSMGGVDVPDYAKSTSKTEVKKGPSLMQRAGVVSKFSKEVMKVNASSGHHLNIIFNKITKEKNLAIPNKIDLYKTLIRRIDNESVIKKKLKKLREAINEEIDFLKLIK